MRAKRSALCHRASGIGFGERPPGARRQPNCSAGRSAPLGMYQFQVGERSPSAQPRGSTWLQSSGQAPHLLISAMAGLAGYRYSHCSSHHVRTVARRSIDAAWAERALFSSSTEPTTSFVHWAASSRRTARSCPLYHRPHPCCHSSSVAAARRSARPRISRRSSSNLPGSGRSRA